MAARSSRSHERGQALAFVGGALMLFIAMAVIGIDVGRLAFTAAEVQSIADAAATAAAGANAAGAADPEAVATSVVEKNYVDAQFASVGVGIDDVVKSIEPGVWDFSAGTFTVSTWNDPLTNAARARAVARVDNLVASAIGFAQSDVERSAIAAAGGSCNGRPLMPIAVGDCYFDQYATGDPADPNRCSLLPNFVMTNDTYDNACFTSLSSSPASASQATGYLPATCCQGGNCGGAQPSPLVSIGDNINIMNGQATSVLQLIQDCFNDGLREWDVPIVACNHTGPDCRDGNPECVKCNQSMVVTGFATIRLSLVDDSGQDKRVEFASICKSNPSSSAGCNDSVTVGLSLVK